MAKSRKENLSDRELWIGLAKVGQPKRNGVLGHADGAYTNAIAIAKSKADFRVSVKQALAELGLLLMRLEDAETLKARLSKHSIDEELASLANEVQATGRPGFGTFHAFNAHSADIK